MKHTYGGIWTRKKLAVLEAYLKFYVTALKNKPFTLHYADAFAGTGSHVPSGDSNQDLLIPYEDFKGSVLTALDVEPGFHQFHFNDLNPKHVRELREIREYYPTKHIQLYQQDANQFVPEFCSKLGWSDRAVLFLDPYSTQLDWSILEYVAASGKVDLWLLFPASVILRMTPIKEDRVISEWKNTLNRLLGTNEWEKSLYRPVKKPPMDDMFGDPVLRPVAERVNTEELKNWVTDRLKDVFPYVAEPVSLDNQGHPLFFFYFAVSNPNKKAWGLANRAASHIIKHNMGRD